MLLPVLCDSCVLALQLETTFAQSFYHAVAVAAIVTFLKANFPALSRRKRVKAHLGPECVVQFTSNISTNNEMTLAYQLTGVCLLLT